MKPFKPFFNRLHNHRFRRAALSLAIVLGFACGPSFDPGEYLSFFQPEISNARPEDRRYFFTPQLYNDDERTEQYEGDAPVDENVWAWAEYAGGKVADTIVSKALYDEDTGAVNALKAALEPTNAPAVAYLELAWAADNGQGNPWEPANTPVDSLKLPRLLADAKAACQRTTDPFLKERYAFQAVKLASLLGEYGQAQHAYDQLIGPLPKKTFISDWALCRRAGASLALGDTARAIYEFAQVFDRCPSRRKAAELSLRKYGIQFDERALQWAKTDAQRAAVYALCAIQPVGWPGAESLGLHDALDWLREIIRLTPQNPLIELIMTREINRNEFYFQAGYGDYTGDGAVVRQDSAGFARRKEDAPSYYNELRSFALESAENKVLAGRSAFWYTAAAYLDYLVADYKAAQTHLDQAQSGLTRSGLAQAGGTAAPPTANADLKNQITVQRMLLLAAQTEAITPPAETELIGYLEAFDSTQNFRINNAFVQVCTQFAAKYRPTTQQKGGWLSGCSRPKAEPDGSNWAKAYLLTMLTTAEHHANAYFATLTDQYAIQDTTPVATIRQVIAYTEQPKPTDFDKRLLTLVGSTSDDLYLLLGRRLMAGHQYAEAAEAFARVNPKMWQNEAFTTYFSRNPFAVKMPRLYSPARRVAFKTKTGKIDSTALLPGLNFPAESSTNPYTPLTFARRMADLAQRAKNASGDQAADLYYQLGCGAWNLSWYGNAWLLTKATWSGSEPSVYPISADPAVNQKRYDTVLATDYYTTSLAESYFAQAAKTARTPALADRAAYMAARCEENAFGIRRSIEQLRNGYVPDDDPAFVKRMQTLRRAEYATAYSAYFRNHTRTPFHDEMIRECGLYSDFLTFGHESDE